MRGLGTEKESNPLCTSFMLLAPTLAPSVLQSEWGKNGKEKRNTVGNKPRCYARTFSRVFRPLAFRN